MSAIGFFASVIKSGEPWTETCQSEYDKAVKVEAENKALLKRVRTYIEVKRAYKSFDKFDVAVAFNELEDLVIKLESTPKSEPRPPIYPAEWVPTKPMEEGGEHHPPFGAEVPPGTK